MGRPLLLDLFCKAGGAGTGYHRAGFDVVGVDIERQKNYPFPIIIDDALDVLRQLNAGWSAGPSMPDGKRYWLRDFAAIHASPPCQRYSQATFCRGRREQHPDLVGPCRDLLCQAAGVWVIENVERSPLASGACMLCGLTFGLKVFRHRLFESNLLLFSPPHQRHGPRRIGKDGFVCVAGHGGQLTGWAGSGTRKTVPADHRNKASWERAMGIDWMTRDELAQAVPPAYTEYIGNQLIAAIKVPS